MDAAQQDPNGVTFHLDHRGSTHGDVSLLCRRGAFKEIQAFEEIQLHEDVIEGLRDAGFYGVYRLSHMKIDHPLITALVERWRVETHSFVLLCGEATVTLEDVQILTGLPIDGGAVTGKDLNNKEAKALCQKLLGRVPTGKDLVGSHVQLSWLYKIFKRQPQSPDDVQCHTRAVILYLLGTYVMPSKNTTQVSVRLLSCLSDLHGCGQLAWGAAALAFLYRELCRATNPRMIEIAGCLPLLQMWAWERMKCVRPVMKGKNSREKLLADDPRGRWWAKNHKRIIRRSLQDYRDLFDQLTEDQMTWMPYKSNSSDLPMPCQDENELWRVEVPLICFEIVETHHPDRVLRQYGCFQHIPKRCDTSIDLHHIDGRSKNSSNDWASFHASYIHTWNRRAEHIVRGDPSAFQMGHMDDYMVWYRRVTGHIMQHPTPSPPPPKPHINLLVVPISQIHDIAVQQLSIDDRPDDPLALALGKIREICEMTMRDNDGLFNVPPPSPMPSASVPVPNPVDPATSPSVRPSTPSSHGVGVFHRTTRSSFQISPVQGDADCGETSASRGPPTVPDRGTTSQDTSCHTPLPTPTQTPPFAQIDPMTQKSSSPSPPITPISWPPVTREWVMKLMDSLDQSSRKPPSDFPSFLPVEVFEVLVHRASEILEEEPNYVKIDDVDADSRVVVVGDLHGQLHDLLFLLRDAGYPGDNRFFVFNGDYVDRGAWGLETFIVLLAWKVLLPKRVFLLRGNHESEQCTTWYGFKDEVLAKYGKEQADEHVYRICLDCFKKLPLASVIAARVYTTHGGLFRSQTVVPSKRRSRQKTNLQTCPQFLGSLEELSKVQRFLPDPWDEDDPSKHLILSDLLWSDPSMRPGLSKNDFRGVGLLWGPDKTEEFLMKSKLKLIIRSHEGPDARYDHAELKGMDKGYTIDHEGESGKLITLFSAPDYPQFQKRGAKRYNNKGAYIILEPPYFDSPVFRSFDAAPRPKVKPYKKKTEAESASTGGVTERKKRKKRPKSYSASKSKKSRKLFSI